MKNKILYSTLIFVILIFLSLITIDKQTYLNYFHEQISRTLSNNGVDIVFTSRNSTSNPPNTSANIQDNSSFFTARIESFKLKNTVLPELNLLNLEIQPSSLLALAPKIKLTGNILGEGTLESSINSTLTNNNLTGEIKFKQIPLASIDILKNIGISNGILEANFSEISFNSKPQTKLFSNFSIVSKNIARPTGKSKDIPEIISGFIPEINALDLNFNGNINLASESQKPTSPGLDEILELSVSLKNISVTSPLIEITANGEYLGDIRDRSTNSKNLGCKNSSIKGIFKLSSLGLERFSALLPLISKTAQEIGTKKHSFTINGCNFKFEIERSAKGIK